MKNCNQALIKIVKKSKNTAFAILAICALASFISAFVENVGTELIVAPIAMYLTKRLRINNPNMILTLCRD